MSLEKKMPTGTISIAMKIYDSAYEPIGRTPLLRLHHLEEEFGLKCKLIVVILPDGTDRYMSTPLFE